MTQERRLNDVKTCAEELPFEELRLSRHRHFIPFLKRQDLASGELWPSQGMREGGDVSEIRFNSQLLNDAMQASQASQDAIVSTSTLKVSSTYAVYLEGSYIFFIAATLLHEFCTFFPPLSLQYMHFETFFETFQMMETS